VWKVLAQTVPDSAKTEEVAEMEAYFRELIRGVDASLVEEWERMKDPEWIAADAGGVEKPARPASYDVTRDTASFRRLIRAEIFLVMQEVARASAGPAGSADEKENEVGRKLFEPYFEKRDRFRLDPEGRAAKHTHFAEKPGDGLAAADELEVAQVLVDAEGANDWEAVFAVSLTQSRAEDRAVVRLVAVRPIGGD
jgi:hypothetical protein